jgi:putative ABC transport system permease protein
MSTIIADFRFAVRSLRRRPVFALTAILTIAIGIGANAAVFTVVSGFMLKPLPYAEPDDLVAIWSARPRLGWSGTDVSHADAWDWRERASTLEDLAVLDTDGFNLTGDGPPELVSGLRVTPNFFSLIGRHPTLGRGFEEAEIGEGRDRVVVLTDGFWQRRFARDPGVLGSTLVLDGIPVVVVGIMPPDFLFHNGRPDVIRPWDFVMSEGRRGNHSANAVARLREGATVELARAELVGIARELESEHPENEGWAVEVLPLTQDVIGEIAARASVVLMAAVGFILLMACVNVANLLLARGGGRSREIALRAALGAGRGRVVRQLLTESLVLAAAGAVLGLASANWAYRGIVAALPPDMPPVFQFGMDATVLGFTAAITVASTLLFGLLPAVRATRDPAGPMRGGRAGVTLKGDSRFGGTLVVLQTAMAVVLLTGGGLLMKSITGMKVQDFGFAPENVLTARLSPPLAEYETAEEAAEYWRAVVERVRDVPGILEAGTTQSHPLMGSNWSRTVRIAGQSGSEDEGRSVRLTFASDGLFETLRFGMVQGRTFGSTDGADAPRVAIVNEAFVRRYLGPDEDPLAQTLLADGDWQATVVGVVHDVIERGVDRPPEPALYLPIAQADVRTRSLVMRTAGQPADIVRAVEDAVWSVDADVPVYRVQTMVELVDDRVDGFAVIGYLMGTFALLSLVLGAIGIYGVTAFAAGQRTSEIGVRLALGARRGDVVSMVVRQGAMRAALGMAIGLALAFAAAGAMSGILVGVSPRDPLIFVGVTLVLGLVASLGLYIPARRASRVDPVRALAAE